MQPEVSRTQQWTPGRLRRVLALVVIPLLTVWALATHVNPATAQDAPNGSVPIDQGRLTVTSNVQPDDTAAVFRVEARGATDFTAVLTGDASTGARTVTAGSYAIALSSPAAARYDTSYACTINGAAGPTGTGRAVDVTVAKDADVVCSFTHVRKTGRVTIANQVEGGSSGADAWRFGIAATAFDDLKSGDGVVLPTGEYTVAVTGPATYKLVNASGTCRLESGLIRMAVTTDGGTCTLTSRAAGLRLLEPYGVSRVQEGQLTGAGSSSCYRIVSTVPPAGNLKIQVTGDGQLSVQPDGPVILNQSNWNLTEGANVSNRVCVRAVDDAIDEVDRPACKNRTQAPGGEGDSGTSVCGEMVSYLAHSLVTSDDLAFNAQTPFAGNTLRDLDGNPATVDVMLVDNDTARIIIQQQQGVTAVAEGGRSASYAVALGSQPLGAVTVKVEATREQITVTPDRLTFGPGNWQTPQMVTVRAVDDPEDDPEQEVCRPVPDGDQVCGDHSATIRHTIESDDANYRAATFEGNGSTNPAELAILIRDNDVAGLQVNPPTVHLVEGEGNTFTVALRTRPTSNVEVTVEDPAVATNAFRPDNRAAVTLLFTPDDWSVARRVALAEADNDWADGTRRRAPSVAISSTDPHYSGQAQAALQLEITDDDSPGVIVDASDLRVFEGGDPVGYALRLTSEPTATVTVSITTDGKTVVEPAAVTFEPATWEAPQTVYVRAVDDSIAHGDMVRDVAVHRTLSADSTYAGLYVRMLNIDVVDNDTAAVNVTPNTGLSVREGGQVTYAVSLQTRPTAPVQVRIESSALLTAHPMTLTFTADNWSEPQHVMLEAEDNYRDSPQDRVEVVVRHMSETDDAQYAAVEANEIVVNVLDNDRAAVLFSAAALAVGTGETGAYSLVLSSEPSSPVLVLLTPSPGLTVRTDCPDGSIDSGCLVFTPENWATPQTVTVTANSSARHTIHHVVVSSDSSYDGKQATLVVDRRAMEGIFRIYFPSVTRGR